MLDDSLSGGQGSWRRVVGAQDARVHLHVVQQATYANDWAIADIQICTHGPGGLMAPARLLLWLAQWLIKISAWFIM